MRLLIDSCSYHCQNVGDLAMLEVAAGRLRELSPLGSIAVITSTPDVVAARCGGVGTVAVRGRRLLLRHRLLGPLERLLPAGARRRWHRVEDRLRVRAPGIFMASVGLRSGPRGRDRADMAAYVSAVAEADLVVVSGAGILTDAFRENALGILTTLDMAQERGIPTAMLGQGVGPIEDDEFRRRAGQVLTRVDLIAVREAGASVPLLLSLGVDPARIVVTGDDAIEMARRAGEIGAQRDRPGRAGIGINLRSAPYADVGSESVGPLREVFHAAAREHGAPLVALPIARHGGGMDLATLRELLPAGADAGAALDTPQKVAARIAECRLVVTGSYHAAVFALAQGIPAIGLVRSAYYRDKFRGLAAQFGGGCEIVTLTGAGAMPELAAAIGRLWADADRLRPALLAAGAEQIRRGRAAYARLLDLISTAGLAERDGAQKPARPGDAPAGTRMYAPVGVRVRHPASTKASRMA